MEKGSAHLLTVFVILFILILSGIYLFHPGSKKDKSLPVPLLTIAKTEKLQEYSNKDLNIVFKYSNGLTVKQDSEEEFNKRGNGDFRKNFKEYVTYEPGKFLGGVVALDKSGNYDTNPFSLWVYDNPQGLTIDQWHHNYWYYPFVWGDFTAEGKFDLAPKTEATISGQPAKFAIIDYQPGKPKFVYLAKDKKMYLFRIIGESGDKILQSFQFK